MGLSLVNKVDKDSDLFCFLETEEISTVGFGYYHKTFIIFPIEIEEVYKEGGCGFFEVSPALNPLTNKNESLIISGYEYRNDFFYKIEEVLEIPITEPYCYKFKAYNEGTFSRAEPFSWVETKMGGSNLPKFGTKEDFSKFEIAFSDLEFRKNSLMHRIDHKYLPSTSTIGNLSEEYFGDGVIKATALNKVKEILNRAAQEVLMPIENSSVKHTISGPVCINKDIRHYNKQTKAYEKIDFKKESPVYFSYGGNKIDPHYFFKIAPGRNNEIWIKPKNKSAKIVLMEQFKKFAEEMFPSTEYTYQS